MPRIVVEAPKGKVTQDGEITLRLRISFAGQRRFIPLPYRISYKDWNPKKREVRKNYADHLKLNNELQNALEQATSSVLDLRARGVILTADRVKDAVAGQLDGGGSDRYGSDFLVYTRERMEDYRRRGQYTTYERLMSTVRKVEAMLAKQRGNATLSFAEVDIRFLNDFETYCIEVRDNKPNTVSESLKEIRTIDPLPEGDHASALFCSHVGDCDGMAFHQRLQLLPPHRFDAVVSRETGRRAVRLRS